MRGFGVSLILLTAILGVSVPASATGSAATRVSVASDGSQANDDSMASAISGDGRYIAFNSRASNLVPGDTNGVGDVFVRDSVTGSTERVSVASDGGQASSESVFASGPAISADGRYVAFESFAGNLVAGDTNGLLDVFVRDRVTGSTERVSVASDGGQTDGDLTSGSSQPAISADGRYVAFRSGASNLVPGDTFGLRDVFMHDRVTRSTERVSVTSDGRQADNHSLDPSISGDGRYVAFGSSAGNLVPGETNGNLDVFVHDRATGSTERVSVASDGTQAINGGSSQPSISADGRYVAFVSNAGNLVPGDTNGTNDVFVHDRVAGSTERVSVANDGGQTNDHTSRASISGDGRYVAFDNFAPGGETIAVADVLVHDRVSGNTERVSIASDDTQADNHSLDPAISGDGRHVAFESLGANLVPGDTNGRRDVFVRDREGGAPSDTTPPTLTLPDPITAEATGPDDATVTYTATATDDTDPNPTVTCAPASGSSFPIGTTTVDCTVTDATGNQAVGSFTVTVVGAAGQTDDLEALILAYPLKATVEASLLNKITGAQDAIAAGKTDAACSKLADFLGQVADFRTAGKLTDAQATELTADGTRTRVVLGC